MINMKSLIVNIFIPLLAGGIGGLLGNSMQGFNNIVKPSFVPPVIVFPIVWIILYILMGISSYIIYKSNNSNKKQALTFYGIQLVFNSIWTFFFFNMKWFLFSFIWILLILFLVLIMFYKFYKISKTAALLQIPYILWLLFASIINYNVYLLN